MGGAIRAIIDSFLVDPVLQPNQLGYAEKTLRESRVTGKLAGVTTPAYIKRGHRVIYDEEDLLQ